MQSGQAVAAVGEINLARELLSPEQGLVEVLWEAPDRKLPQHRVRNRQGRHWQDHDEKSGEPHDVRG